MLNKYYKCFRKSSCSPLGFEFCNIVKSGNLIMYKNIGDNHMIMDFLGDNQSQLPTTSAISSRSLALTESRY